MVAASGVVPRYPVVSDVEALRRVSAETSWLFVINHGDAPATVPAFGVDLLTGDRVGGELSLAAGAVAVIREADAGTISAARR